MAKRDKDVILTGSTLVGRYRLDRLLGTGGMGQVYLACDLAQGERQVAVKTLRDPETARWIRKEFETVSLMVHPNIARVFDFGKDLTLDQVFYTCEYVAGKPAQEAVAGYSFADKLDTCAQILRALHYIHAQGYLHCDMKPQNVLVEETFDLQGQVRPTARVLDFGLATVVPRQAMAVRGTYSYMAPEWFQGGVPGAYTDIYSTGIMFYEMTFSALPFEAVSTQSCVDFHLEGELEFPPDSDVPDWWRNILLTMTSKEVADRYLSARDCLAAIRRHAGQELAVFDEEQWSPDTGLGGPWLGRQDVLLSTMEFADRCLERIHDGGAMLFLEGFQGVGKTRLLQELKRRFQLEGRTVVQMSGASPHGAFGPLVSVLEGLLGKAEAFTQDRVAHRVTALTNRLLEFGAGQPVVLLVDDVHSLDEHSRQFLLTLLNSVRFNLDSAQPTARLAVIATHPQGDRDTVPLADHSLATFRTIPLMEQEDVQRLMTLALGVGSIPDELLKEGWAASKGRPKLVAEFTLFLRDAACLTYTPDGLRFDRRKLPRKGLPGSVEQYLKSAWKNFGTQEKNLLSTLAALYSAQSLPVLSEIAGMDVWELDTLLADLAQRGLVGFQVQLDRPLPIIDVATHKKLFLSGLTNSQQHKLHERIATVLEREHSLRKPLHASLAFHWYHAGRADQCAPHAIPGARYQLEKCNFHRSLELTDIAVDTGAEPSAVAELYFTIYRLWGRYGEGVQCLERLAGTVEEQTEKGVITLHIAELLFRSGSYEDSLKRIESLLARDNSARGQALALQARIYFFQGKHDLSRSTGEEGMLALPQQSREFALCASMVGLVRVYEGKFKQGAKYLETALGVMRHVGTASDVSFVQNSVGLAYHRLKDFKTARLNYETALNIAQTAGDAERTTISSMNLSVLLQETGEFGEAIQRYQRALAMAYQSQNLTVLVRLYFNLGNIHRYLGMLKKALDFTQRSLELAGRLDMRLMQGLGYMLAGEILTFQEQGDQAHESLDKAEKIFEELSALDEQIECSIDRIELLSSQGKSADAAGLGHKTLALARSHNLHNHALRTALAGAQAMLDGDDPADADKAQEMLVEVERTALDSGNPELQWRLWTLRTFAHSRKGAPSKVAATARKAETALAALRQKIPEDFHSVFFKRADRQRVLNQFSQLSSRLAQLADTIQPGTGPGRSVARRQKWMSQLIQFNKRLVSEYDLEKLLEALIDVVVDLSDAERGFVLLRAKDGLEVVVARNMDREVIRKSRSKFSTSIAQQVMVSGETVRLDDAIEAGDFREKESVMALRIRSVVCLPLPGRSGTMGAMYLDNRFKPGVFDEEVIDMLKAFSEQAALAVDNAQLIQRYQSSVAQLEKSQAEVERLNARLAEKVRFQEALLAQKSEEIEHQQAQLEDRYQFGSIVGRSRAIRSMFSIMERIKEADVPVLIVGESGVGKELVARALHYNGARKNARFVSINCAALPDSLLESELFGYVKGAFTDAQSEKKGLFTIADQGTLFLDEVGDMSLAMQAKLLRVLQEGEFTPLGSEVMLTSDVRIVAATNRDLKEMVKTSDFRQDLYYRLDVVSIEVPPLRRRKEDVPLLIEHFLEQYAANSKTAAPVLSSEAGQALMSYNWPGNIRELQSAVMTAAVFAVDGVIRLESLRTKPEVLATEGTQYEPLRTLDDLELRHLEKRAIIAALQRTDGNKLKAARLLGISRRALYNKLEAYGIQLPGSGIKT